LLSNTFNGLKIYLNVFAAGALSRTPLGSLQRSPDSLAGFKGRREEGRLEGEWESQKRSEEKRKAGKEMGRRGAKIPGGARAHITVAVKLLAINE